MKDGDRAIKSLGGGALLDMGYHIIDLLVWYFGLPTNLYTVNGYKNKPDQIYDVEDSSKTLFEYRNGNKKIMGSLFVSRIYPEKTEKLTIIGTKGIIELKKGQIKRLNLEGEEIENLSRVGKWPSAAIEQIDYFSDLITSKSQDNPYLDHFKHQAFLEACFLSDKNNSTQNPQVIYKNICL